MTNDLLSLVTFDLPTGSFLLWWGPGWPLKTGRNIFFILILFVVEIFAKPSHEGNLISIKNLHPTQGAVGFLEVESKEKKFINLDEKKKKKLIEKSVVPVVVGLDKKMYMIDQHHYVSVARRQKVKKVYYEIVGDFSDSANLDVFWKKMQEHGWVYLKVNGVPIDPKDLPETIDKLVDDQYRSLAGQVREEGGFEKTTIPFAEFFWADYFRPQIQKSIVEFDFKKAVELAIEIAHIPAAAGLPGFKSEIPDKKAAGF